MDLDSPFSLYGFDENAKMRPPMVSPPMDTISLAPHPFEMEHIYNHSWNLERKKRLETHLDLHEKCVRGAVPSLPPYFTQDYESPGHHEHFHNTSTTYHIPGPFGKEPNAFYGGAAAVVGPSDFDYPSPFGVGASSVSETDRSPSPQQALGYHPGFRINTSHPYPRVWDGDHTGYGSVIPRDVQHVHEPTYPEAENLPVHQKVSQIYDPCGASVYHTQGEILSDLEITDDVDADGEPDAMCDRDINSIPTQRVSKMPKTKKPTRNHHQGTAGNPVSPSGVRKRAAAPRKASASSQGKSSSTANNNSKPQAQAQASKEASADGRTYACSFKSYGCESTFSSKNEWKRHFSSQHLKLHYYRCDLDGCRQSNKGPNDFNRKDLFTQHLRRMHAPWTGKPTTPTQQDKARFEASLDEHHERCRQEQRRPPPLSRCMVCNKVFTVWQDRMEHMSKHYEDDARFEEPEDHELVQWALQEGILCRKQGSGELVLADKRGERKPSS